MILSQATLQTHNSNQPKHSPDRDQVYRKVDNVSFLDACLPRAERKAGSMRNYKFACACAFGGDSESSPAHSDGRRRYVQQSSETVFQHSNGGISSRARAGLDTTRGFLGYLKTLCDFASKEWLYISPEDVALILARTYLALGGKENCSEMGCGGVMLLGVCWGYNLNGVKKRRSTWQKVMRKTDIL